MRGATVIAAVAAMTTLAPATSSVKPTARTAVVVLDKLAFGAVPSNLRVGDTILWTNRDIFRHSATSAGKFDVDLPPNSKRWMVLGKAGVYLFTCKYHPGMKGVLKVGR